MEVKVLSNSYNRKVSIIGAGFVGASITYALMLKDLAREIVLIDAKEETSLSEMLDIRHGIPYMGSANIRCGNYSDIKDSDLIIMTAGRNRRQGESRLNMASDNIKIAYGVTKEIEKYYTKGVILVVSNPNDIVTFKMNEWLALPDGIVFGTGCVLDGSRFINVIADFVDLNSEIISAQVIGEHGDSQIPLWSKVTIAGIPIHEYCETLRLDLSETQKKDIENKVLEMGGKIIFGKGKTHYGIATCVCYIADAILNRRATIACVSSVLYGEYGIKEVALSLPSIINFNGVTKRLEDHIDDFEYKRLINSADVIKAVVKQV